MSLLDKNGVPSGMKGQSSGSKCGPICCSSAAQLKVSPTSCTKPRISGGGTVTRVSFSHSNSEHACSECWKAHLSLQVQEKVACEIKCMFYPSVLSRADVVKLGRVDTAYQYDMNITNATRYKCMARCKGVDTELQDRDEGFTFTCKDCNFEVRLSCDLPNHPNETCEQRQQRIRQSQQQSEDEFRNGQLFPQCPDAQIAGQCPQCSMPFTLDKGCGYTQCSLGETMSKLGLIGGCGHRFCSECFINWTGEASAYLGGKMQHGTKPGADGKLCKYFTKSTASTHGLQHRFEQATEAQLRESVTEELSKGFEEGRELAREKDRKKVVRREKFEAKQKDKAGPKKRAAEDKAAKSVAKKAKGKKATKRWEDALTWGFGPGE